VYTILVNKKYLQLRSFGKNIIFLYCRGISGVVSFRKVLGGDSPSRVRPSSMWGRGRIANGWRQWGDRTDDTNKISTDDSHPYNKTSSKYPFNSAYTQYI